MCRAWRAGAQVREAARRRWAEAQIRRGFERARAVHRAELARWELERRTMVATLLGIPLEEVTAVDIVLCRAEHGVPQGEQPRLRMDRRFGPRTAG
ncbi:hypothetical protein BJF78_24770 [Pseudonocardia sp. CNS-139]|nr:hypothetical protein BJF78_24770 [Pseudonocardia sp. CNS-139]